MVLTDVPFDRPNFINDRYSLLLRPGERGVDTLSSDSEEEDETPGPQKYAAFLKTLKKTDKPQTERERPYSDGPTWLREKERMAGPDGFVDSKRHQHPYRVHKAKKEHKRKSLSGRKSLNFTVVDLAGIKQRDQKEYDKRLKVIEDHMWQHKQEERELKRVEGDVIKNQRVVRKELRDYENAITRKRLAEEKKLNQGLERFTNLQKQHVQHKEELVNQRRDQNITEDQSIKDGGRKVQITTNTLARQYRTKISELELKRSELDTLSEDFEAKLRRKEEEQFKLKQELAELSIAINMEAQKGRVQQHEQTTQKKAEEKQRIDTDLKTQKSLDTKLAKSDGVTKAAINEKRKLSANLSLTRAHLQLKQREESRTKYDTEQRLKSNQAEQRQLNEAAMYAELDLKQKKIDQRIQEHNSRKTVQMMTQAAIKKSEDDEHDTLYSHKFAKRAADQARREHEDHLKHFQKSVQMGEEQEYTLYNKVKNAEYSRQKQEQSVRKLHSKLLDRKRENEQKLKKEMLEATKEEQDIQYKLDREKASLAKFHSEREEMYNSLQKHRHRLTTDRDMLGKHEREHNRLQRISLKTEQQAALYHAQREEVYLQLQKHRKSLTQDRHMLTKHQREHERLQKIGMKTEAEASAVGVS